MRATGGFPQTRSPFARRAFVLKALGILFLFAILLCRAEDIEGSKADDSDAEVSELEAALQAGRQARTAAPVRIFLGTNGLAALRSGLRESNGTLTPALREAYLDWAQATVLANLATSKCSVPPDCLAEVLSNPTLRDAMFAAIYPPDPSILQNYARLRSELGAGFLKKYRSLVVGVAVAERVGGLLGAAQTAQPPPPARKRKAVRLADNSQLVGAVAEFMRQNAVTALDLYTNADQRERLVATLGRKGFSAKELAGTKDPGRLFGVLKQAMIRLGQRPAAREAMPSTADWLRHLATIYEAEPSSTPPRKKGKADMPWPLFPMNRAPWPLLMPFARPVPLGEADYIWETFQGRHGNPRYHTYGPYKGPQGERPLESAAVPLALGCLAGSDRPWRRLRYHGYHCLGHAFGAVRAERSRRTTAPCQPDCLPGGRESVECRD